MNKKDKIGNTALLRAAEVHISFYSIVFLVCEGACMDKSGSEHGGKAGYLNPGLWKIPPRIVENSTQAFGKSHPGFWKTAKFAKTVRLYFLR